MLFQKHTFGCNHFTTGPNLIKGFATYFRPYKMYRIYIAIHGLRRFYDKTSVMKLIEIRPRRLSFSRNSKGPTKDCVISRIFHLQPYYLIMNIADSEQSRSHQASGKKLKVHTTSRDNKHVYKI